MLITWVIIGLLLIPLGTVAYRAYERYRCVPDGARRRRARARIRRVNPWFRVGDVVACLLFFGAIAVSVVDAGGSHDLAEILLVIVGWLGILGWSAVQRHWTRQRLHRLFCRLEVERFLICPDCRYVLTAHPEGGRCPLCGYEFTPDSLYQDWVDIRNLAAAGVRR